jgi:hypothetical protein
MSGPYRADFIFWRFDNPGFRSGLHPGLEDFQAYSLLRSAPADAMRNSGEKEKIV